MDVPNELEGCQSWARKPLIFGSLALAYREGRTAFWIARRVGEGILGSSDLFLSKGADFQPSLTNVPCTQADRPGFLNTPDAE